jgi:CheY-like chemotaxis protein
VKTVLVVDDEPRIVELARDYLEHAGFGVITATDGPSALTAARIRKPDVLVLDLGLPGMDGLDVARAIRRDSTLPIIMLTARDDELDRVLGLEIGADDYVTKPFSPRELVARIRAILRRVDRQEEPSDRIEVGGVSIDVARMRVDGRRPNRRADADRVPAAGRPGPPARPHLHPVAAARRHPRRGLRVVRAGHRRPRQEPAPQARGRSRPAAYVLTVYGVGYRFAEEPE